jgi:methyl-accepting chemotaxis protein
MDTVALYQHAAVATTPPHAPGWWIKQTTRLRFNGKMALLLVLVLVCTLLGNLSAAFTTRDAIRESIDAGLINQVTGVQQLLQQQLTKAPEQFLQASRDLLTGLRWGEQQSGYFFLADRQGRLLIYPPKAAKEGNFLDPVQVIETNEDVTQAFARIGRGDEATLIHYPYVKPGSTTKTLKAAYVAPIGDYLLISGVYMDAADTAFNQYLIHSALVLLATLLVMVLVIALISRAINSQVRQSLNELRLIANRNLSHTIYGLGRDEFADINRELEHTRRNLCELLSGQRDTSVTLSAASAQINHGMHQVGTAVQDQRERLDALAAAMEEMSATIRDVALNAQQSAQDSNETDRMVHRGVSQLGHGIDSIRQLFANLGTSSDSVAQVETEVSAISSVVSTISSISEQTNLLALNAAIEAARAGDQGRGFAVVADEVRQLARRTQQATHEIDVMISSLQQGTRQAVQQMEVSVSNAESAMQDAEAANFEFASIASQIGQLAQRGDMIAAAAEQQSHVSSQVTDSLVVIRDAVEETEHVVRELSQASQSLHHEAQSLENMVNSYQL